MKSFVVIDIETRAAKDLIKVTKYPGASLTDDEAYDQYRAELVEKSGSDFLPIGFHVPISIAVGRVDESYWLLAVETLAEKASPADQEEAMVKDFWALVNEGHTLVTYNGRGFDLPVLELTALQYGIQSPGYWNGKFGYRYRYQEDMHYDVAEVLCNTGAVPRMALNAVMLRMGWQGKGEVNGSKVQQMWEDGKIEDIHAYCRRDVVASYALWLRLEYIRGRLSPYHYQEVRVGADAWLKEIK